MIEATCGACGTVARIAETDVPVGAKFVTCASCKSRVPLPQQQKAGAKPPATPAKGVAIPPSIPKRPPVPGGAAADLADLPAPKPRGSALGDAPPSKPAARSALDSADLPAPRTAKPAAPSALDLDDLMPPAKGKSDAGLADLPAPKPRASALGDAPPSRPAPSALADLPAPKAKPSALADLPAPKAKPSALADLPAPKSKGPDLSDLPAPKGKGGGVSDLPAPKGKSPLDLGDLPAPKAKGGGMLDFDDLPAPKGGGRSNDLDLDLPSGFSDLPAPKPGANNDGLAPKPGANNDGIAPKGFFDDLPQPAKKQGGIDLPAPKGFFDDLPAPAAKATVDLPAPKGFFDDLPQPAKPAAAAPAGGGGFFDDLPQPSKAAKAPAAPAAGGGGFFDDLPQPSKAAKGGDDLAFGGTDLDMGLPGDKPFELDTGGGPGPELDLGLPLGENQSFTDLDLSTPSSKSSQPAEPDSPIKIKTPKGGAPAKPIAITVKKDAPADLKLDLAEDPHHGKGGEAAAVSAGGKATPKRKAGLSPEAIAELAAKKKKRTRVVLASVLGLALVGSGGFYFYQKHAAEQARKDQINEQLATARKALGDDKPTHWQKASAAANSVLELEPNNGAALGLAAEAAIAGALDNGINFDARVKQGRKLAQQGLGAGKTGPEMERAQALMAIAAGQSDRAIPLLQKQIGAAPKDGWLQLYMGWAQLVKGDAAAAQSAFEQAVALNAATKLPALYGHGQAKLLKADIEGAKTDFAAVLETDKTHVGAQVGLAATLAPQQSAQREADLRAILQRPDIDKADPRAVVKAWTMLGDVARASSRNDIARESYRKAIALSQLEVPALTGLASVELRDGKVQIARDLLAKALTAKPEDAETQLLDAEADIFEGKLPDAGTKLAKLGERQPPLPTLQLARLHLVKGRLLDAQGKSEDAIAEYTEGAKLAGELDLTPTIAAVTKLSDLAKKAPDEATALGYRARADQLLSALAERAKEDGELSMTLGTAYLQAGDAAKAEEHLRRAVAMRDKDPESRLQLAKAYNAQNKGDEAIAQLKDALSADPKRGDIMLELARTYQTAGKHAEAMATYDKLLAEPNVPVIVRVAAGRYFASQGAMDKAAAQAEPVLAAEPDNAGGFYLKGEGLILKKSWDEARKALTRATDLDTTDAQGLDALGRAFEGSLGASDDTKYIESARNAYDRASKADPKLFHAHLGLGRMLVAQQHWNEAIAPLNVASGLDKSNSEVMYQMGLAYFGLRSQSPAHKNNAAVWLENALRSKPELALELRADVQWHLGQLYVDLNKAGPAAAAMENATHLGEEIEKNGGKSPPWLTELYYELGDTYYKLGNKSAQKRAWIRYLARTPKPGAHKTDAEYQLATELKNY